MDQAAKAMAMRYAVELGHTDALCLWLACFDRDAQFEAADYSSLRDLLKDAATESVWAHIAWPGDDSTQNRQALVCTQSSMRSIHAFACTEKVMTQLRSERA